MNTMQKMVEQFHDFYNIPKRSSPGFPGQDRLSLRKKLIQEESRELFRAMAEHDLVETADAIGDLLYVVFGTAIEFGMDMDPIFEEIQRSNLSKLGEDGKPVLNEHGKVLKGPNFTPPELLPILRQQGFRG